MRLSEQPSDMALYDTRFHQRGNLSIRVEQEKQIRSPHLKPGQEQQRLRQLPDGLKRPPLVPDEAVERLVPAAADDVPESGHQDASHIQDRCECVLQNNCP